MNTRRSPYASRGKRLPKGIDGRLITAIEAKQPEGTLLWRGPLEVLPHPDDTEALVRQHLNDLVQVLPRGLVELRLRQSHGRQRTPRDHQPHTVEADLTRMRHVARKLAALCTEDASSAYGVRRQHSQTTDAASGMTFTTDSRGNGP